MFSLNAFSLKYDFPLDVEMRFFKKEHINLTDL